MTGKRLRKAYADFDPLKIYSLTEALALVKKNATAKFDETFEISMNLNVDPRKAEQNIRGVVQLPHGTGKTVRVAVFAKEAQVEEAIKAGADIAGSEELIDRVQKGFMDFDRCIATPDMMAQVGKLGKILGPRGLMPNPKLGTVTMDVATAIKAVKGGQVEYRTEKTGIIQAGIGKISFSEEFLLGNLRKFVHAILKARPAGVSGTYIHRIHLASTMGPSVMVNVAECTA